MLSQACGYAITAMGRVAASGGRPVLVKEISVDAGIPGPYLAKIVNALSRRKLLHTQRGVGGGVTLARPATEVTLLDVCQALDEDSIKPVCMLGNAECSDARSCPAHKFWTAQRSALLKFLEQTSVADIAAFEARRLWRRPDAERAAAAAGSESADTPPVGPSPSDRQL